MLILIQKLRMRVLIGCGLVGEIDGSGIIIDNDSDDDSVAIQTKL